MIKMDYKNATRYYDVRWVSEYPKYFYERYHFFQKFQTITEKNISEIENHLQIWIASETYQSCQNIKQKYLKTLFYLNEYLMAPFDEKVYFLIQAVDPNVEILQTYEISNTKKEAKENLFQRFGFADLHLARMEQAYAEKFLQPGEWRFEQIAEEQLQNNFFSLERKKKPKS